MRQDVVFGSMIRKNTCLQHEQKIHSQNISNHINLDHVNDSVTLPDSGNKAEKHKNSTSKIQFICYLTYKE